ncbi:MAG: hypothetical protein LBS52_02300 [Dysgonamonadaceae bacterium]|jgi:hypothetical protein|nr:hypothetical protein [Dysgonamonadaceae bacterium]
MAKNETRYRDEIPLILQNGQNQPGIDGCGAPKGVYLPPSIGVTPVKLEGAIANPSAFIAPASSMTDTWHDEDIDHGFGWDAYD